jgi:ABC-type antimicrobial peptide transport system permease subunit
MALGAEPGEVVRLVVTQGSALALVGIGIGLAVSLALGLVFAGPLSGLLFDVSLRDPLIFVGIPLLLAAAALFASAQPAWRASRVDPTVALRVE